MILLRNRLAECVLERLQLVQRWRREHRTLTVRNLVLQIEV